MSQPAAVFERSAVWTLGTLAIVLLALRVPVILKQIPAQDEDYFAVPGETILKEGIPRIPYMPSRNPAGAFYRADEMLFTLPPAYFYWEAAWYAALGPSTAVARLASLAAGLMALPILYWLGMRWTGNRLATGLGVGLYGLSRVFLFPCVIARPDMLCGFWGLAALAAAESWRTDRRPWRLVGAGALIGAGFLTHPFALVYALQIGVWVVLTRGSLLARLGRGALLTGTALAVFSLWGILIVQKPELFQKQFFNNVLNQAGPGLPSRVVSPWASIQRQTVLFREHAGTIQGAWMIAGLAGIFFVGLAAPQNTSSSGEPSTEEDGSRGAEGTGLVRLGWLTLSSVYLLIICQGQHPTKGYWCFPGALMFLCAAVVLTHLVRPLCGEAESSDGPEGSPSGLVRKCPMIFAGLLAVGTMLPGSGIRATAEYIRHWNDIDYDAPRFTERLIAELPPRARFIVDPGYIFDFYLAGRDVHLGLVYDFFYDVAGTPYDYVVGGPYSLRDKVPEAVAARFLRDYGNPSDPFACYARIYRAPESARPADPTRE